MIKRNMGILLLNKDNLSYLSPLFIQVNKIPLRLKI